MRKEEERKKKIRMQRPAIMRLLESHSAEKVQEILNEELLDQEGQVDFYEIGE